MKDELTKKTGLSKRGRKLRAKKGHQGMTSKYSIEQRREWCSRGGLKTAENKK